MTGKMKRVVALGECMIELRETSASTMLRSFGGDTLNSAIYLARLAGNDYQVCYATALGEDDPHSEQMLAQWRAENIDTRYVRRIANLLPGIYTIQVDDKGERSFSYWRQNSAAREYFNEANSPLERSADEIDVLYASGISLAILPEAARTRLIALMQQLSGRGACVVFDNNYRPRLWSSAEEARDVYRLCYAAADIALVTLDDEMAVLGVDEATALEQACAYQCREVVIKRGARPSLVRCSDGKRIEVAAEKVERVVDTTAAGDSFGAGYLAARLKGLDEALAARAGNRMAATVIQFPGAIIPMGNMPNAETLFGK